MSQSILCSLVFLIRICISQNQYQTGVAQDTEIWEQTSATFVPTQPAAPSLDGSAYGTIRIGQIMSMEFDVTFHGPRPSDRREYWQPANFFRIGRPATTSGNCFYAEESYPSMWYTLGVEDSGTLEIRVNSGSSCSPSDFDLGDLGDVNLDTEHHMKISLNMSQVVVEITGAGTGKPDPYTKIWSREPTPNDEIGVAATVFFITDAYSGAGTNTGPATFKNIVITSNIFGANITAAPTMDGTANHTQMPSLKPTANPSQNLSLNPSATRRPTLSTESPSKLTELKPDIAAEFNITILSPNITAENVVSVVEELLKEYLSVKSHYTLSYDVIRQSSNETIILFEIEIEINDIEARLEPKTCAFISNEDIYLNYTQGLADNITEEITIEFEGEVVVESDAFYISWFNTIKEELSTRSSYELISIYSAGALAGLWIVISVYKTLIRVIRRQNTKQYQSGSFAAGLWKLYQTMNDILFILTIIVHRDFYAVSDTEYKIFGTGYCSSDVLTVMVLSLVTLFIVPHMISMGILFCNIQKWDVSGRQMMLFIILSVFTGNAFTAVKLIRGLFNTPDEEESYHFQVKRLTPMVVLQNIPQAIIEIAFMLFTTQKKITDPMAFLSLIVTSASFVEAVTDIYAIYKEGQSNKRVKKAQQQQTPQVHQPVASFTSGQHNNIHTFNILS